MMKWLAALVDLFRVKPMDPIRAAGIRAADEAVRLWKLDVYDPPKGDKRARTPFCLKIITDIIVKTGWKWQLLENGGDGTYKGNGPPQWCGLFAAYCWMAAAACSSSLGAAPSSSR